MRGLLILVGAPTPTKSPCVQEHSTSTLPPSNENSREDVMEEWTKLVFVSAFLATVIGVNFRCCVLMMGMEGKGGGDSVGKRIHSIGKIGRCFVCVFLSVASPSKKQRTRVVKTCWS